MKKKIICCFICMLFSGFLTINSFAEKNLPVKIVKAWKIGNIRITEGLNDKKEYIIYATNISEGRDETNKNYETIGATKEKEIVFGPIPRTAEEEQRHNEEYLKDAERFEKEKEYKRAAINYGSVPGFEAKTEEMYLKFAEIKEQEGDYESAAWNYKHGNCEDKAQEMFLLTAMKFEKMELWSDAAGAYREYGDDKKTEEMYFNAGEKAEKEKNYLLAGFQYRDGKLEKRAIEMFLKAAEESEMGGDFAQAKHYRKYATGYEGVIMYDGNGGWLEKINGEWIPCATEFCSLR